MSSHPLRQPHSAQPPPNDPSAEPVTHGPPGASNEASNDDSCPAGTQPPRGALRVLVVEDHADTAEVMQLLLEFEGMYAVVAHDGAEGERTARRTRPTLILSDLDMPEVDGYALAARLRADPQFAHTPLVAVTASADDRCRQRARTAGFTRFLAKPVDPAYLIRTVREVLKRRRRTAPYAGPDRRAH
jgi:CheY-like chemotaxis protein